MQSAFLVLIHLTSYIGARSNMLLIGHVQSAFLVLIHLNRQSARAISFLGPDSRHALTSHICYINRQSARAVSFLGPDSRHTLTFYIGYIGNLCMLSPSVSQRLDWLQSMCARVNTCIIHIVYICVTKLVPYYSLHNVLIFLTLYPC